MGTPHHVASEAHSGPSELQFIVCPLRFMTSASLAGVNPSVFPEGVAISRMLS